MQRASSELLAGAALTREQDVLRAVRGEGDAFAQAPHARGFAQNAHSVRLTERAEEWLAEVDRLRQ